MASAARPRASIVIPVWNRADLTRACLAALDASTPADDYELIVVDNGSTDGTAYLLAERAGAGRLRAIRNRENLGFATACNQGAAAANAKRLVFLNNDTTPTPGWLESLLAAADEPHVGAVGARLLYPDGRIQHAGIELIDGVPDHPSRFAAADAPEVNCRRKLDMVTGACLLVDRALFERLGGFDTAYVNGVEDVDLCLRIRETGHRVLYEPGAVVVHHEGQTPGRFDHVGPNLQRFFDRWGSRFDDSGRFVSCVWRGDSGSTHSLAVVNDGLAGALEQLGTHVGRIPTSAGSAPHDATGVAQQWPPDFEAPSAGPFVLYQPWEFGEIPAVWVEPIRRRVDEVWTPSEYSRQAYLAAGIAPDLVHVVPNGVDLDRFAPAGPRAVLPTEKGTVFLFVGGTMYRKGIDALLAAYDAAFTAADDVALVVKGFGSKSYYAGQTAEALFDVFRSRPGAPELVTLDEELPFAELPALYRAADVVVQPYRGEGFCLPALEALACGVPLIVTAGGPTDDFATDACAWRIPSTRIPLAADAFAAEGLAPGGRGFLLEPDANALAAALREAADPSARAARAAEARPHAERFGWPQAAARARERLAALAGRTPIRFSAPAEVPERRGTLFLAAADWDAPDTWTGALRAYVQAFSPDDDVTLVLPATEDDGALTLVVSELERAGIDPAAAPDIALADPGPLGPHSLELAADAVISADDRSWRSRLVVPPDPTALRALVPIAEEAA